MKAAQEYAIAMNGVVKNYKSTTAVNGLTMRVPQGAVYGLLGRNGAGKTTTIRVLVSLARASAGTISVLGLDPVRDRIAMLARTGYVPDEKTLVGMTGTKLLEWNKEFYPETWSDAHATEYVRRFEIPMETQFYKLSLGNKTKLYLVLALAQRPELLILDEPTSGLDPVATDVLLRILIEDFAAEGRTVLFSTHQLKDIEQICDWVGVLHQGQYSAASGAVARVLHPSSWDAQSTDTHSLFH